MQICPVVFWKQHCMPCAPITVGGGSAFCLFNVEEELLSRYSIQQLGCLGNVLDDSNELIVSLSKVTVYTGTGVHLSGKSRRNGFLISFVLITEAEGSRSSCSVSATYH